MGIETLNAMNEGIYLSLMLMIKVIVLISLLCAIAGLAIYLAGVASFCFEKRRRSKIVLRTVRRTLSPKILNAEIYVSNTQVRTNY